MGAIVRRTPASGLVDAGNLLFPLQAGAPSEAEQHRVKSELLARVYRELGVVALNVGQTEAAAWPQLQALQRRAAMPWVSANVHPAAESGPSIAHSFIRTVGGIRFGLTGAVLPESVTATQAFAVLEHGPAVANEVRVLQEDGAEVVLVLARVGRAAAQVLAEVVPDIDVIVYGPGSELGEPPEPVGRTGSTLLVEAGSEGRYLGALDFRLQKGPLRWVDEGAADRRQRKLQALRQELDGLKRAGASPAVLRARQERIDRLQGASTPPPPGASTVRVRRIPLEASLPEDPVIKAELDEYYRTLVDLNQGRGDRTACRVEEGGPVFVGNQACTSCHAEAVEFWAGTAHARAWSTLQERGKHGDLTCVGCHSVGFRRPGGWCRLEDLSNLSDVGCESCHGPGSRHVLELEPIDRADDVSTCASVCHVPEHSDAFEWGSYRAAIVGPGHGAPVR
jgi:hypothetical protein